MVNLSKKCPICGKKFVKDCNYSYKYWRSKKFCSYKCYWKSLKGKARPDLRKDRINRDGYWYILKPEHPNSGKQGYIAKSRLVVEKHLGRYLEKGEVVHHINHNRQDDRIENLKLYKSAGEHSFKEHTKRDKNGQFKRKSHCNSPLL